MPKKFSAVICFDLIKAVLSNAFLGSKLKNNNYKFIFLNDYSSYFSIEQLYQFALSGT